jgi:MSHA biogenesis protein MshQ
VNGTPAGAPTYTSTYAGGLPTCGSLPATCTAGTLTPSTLAWSAGTAFGFPVLLAPVNYSEAGTFLVEFEDATFANVDIGDGTPATGASGRTIPQHTGAGTPIEVGRFVPASFTVTTTNAPQFRTFDSSCAGARSFTYIGQTFDYATKPTATITAVNAAGVKTSNYNGALWKIGLSTNTPSKDCTSNPDICVFTNSWSGGSASSTLTETYTYSLAPATTPNWNDASVVQAAATVTAGIGGAVGTGTVTFASSSVFAFKRSATTPLVPFTASISDSISVQDTSETNAIGTSSAAAFSVGFDSGNEFRYGRARLQNATGSEVINLKVPFRTEYYTGAGFQLNAADNCTSVSGGAGGNFAFSGYSGGLNAGNLPTSNIVSGGAVTAGVGSLTVNKPSAAVSGSVTLCLDLETNDGACSAGATAVQGWLQGPWGSSSHDKDPRARVAFGLYGAQPTTVIFFRENY